MIKQLRVGARQAKFAVCCLLAAALMVPVSLASAEEVLAEDSPAEVVGGVVTNSQDDSLDGGVLIEDEGSTLVESSEDNSALAEAIIGGDENMATGESDEATPSEETVVESEDGDPQFELEATNQTKSLTIGSSFSGSLQGDKSAINYSFTLSSPGRFSLEGSLKSNSAVYFIFSDSKFNSFFKVSYTSDSDFSQTYFLNAGSYYLTLQNENIWWGGYDVNSSWNLKTSFSRVETSFSESQSGTHTSAATAQQIKTGTRYSGLVSVSQKTICYKFTVAEGTKVKISYAVTSRSNLNFNLQNANGKSLWSTYNGGSFEERSGSGFVVTLGGGTYYFYVTGPYLYSFGTFNFTVHEYQPMHRLYNPYNGDHLWTSDQNEVNKLTTFGWNYEEIKWYAPRSGNNIAKVYRLYNKYSGDHHYTKSPSEYSALQAIGWTGEGVAFYSATSEDGEPIYRLYNKWLKQGTHLYTSSKSEYNYNGKIGWKKEGIAFYGADV